MRVALIAAVGLGGATDSRLRRVASLGHLLDGGGTSDPRCSPVAGPGHVIGRAGLLPWRLPADLKRFKKLTLGKPVLMGRRTFASLRKPLPGRTNIVLTRDPAFAAEGVLVVHDVEQALAAAERVAGPDGELMVIGGAEVYQLFLPRADRLYLTEVQGVFPGDTYFPTFDPAEFREVACQEVPPDARNQVSHRYRVLVRVRPAAGTHS